MKKFIVYTLALLLMVHVSQAQQANDIKAALSNAATTNTSTATPTPATDLSADAPAASAPEGFGTDARDNEIWVTAKTTETDLAKMRHYVSANNDSNTLLFILNALLLLIVGAGSFIVIMYIIKKRRGLSFS